MKDEWQVDLIRQTRWKVRVGIEGREKVLSVFLSISQLKVRGLIVVGHAFQIMIHCNQYYIIANISDSIIQCICINWHVDINAVEMNCIHTVNNYALQVNTYAKNVQTTCIAHCKCTSYYTLYSTKYTLYYTCTVYTQYTYSIYIVYMHRKL